MHRCNTVGRREEGYIHIYMCVFLQLRVALAFSSRHLSRLDIFHFDNKISTFNYRRSGGLIYFSREGSVGVQNINLQ